MTEVLSGSQISSVGGRHPEALPDVGRVPNPAEPDEKRDTSILLRACRVSYPISSGCGTRPTPFRPFATPPPGPPLRGREAADEDVCQPQYQSRCQVSCSLRGLRNLTYISILYLIVLAGICSAQTTAFPWLDEPDSSSRFSISDIAVPPGYQRVDCDSGSFGEWLRSLPLKPEGNAVRLYDGRMKSNQHVHHRVLDIDVGNRDLQQCADAVMRLRAEYLYGHGRYDDIHFIFTSGDKASFRSWIDGFRPNVRGNSVNWSKTADRDSSYSSFRKYMNVIFSYCGTYSLRREMTPVAAPDSIRVGDVFIQGAFPGHAVIVVDIAVNASDGSKVILLAQSYMPAQEIHILRNLRDPNLSPWFEVGGADSLYTPEWTFGWDDLRRF